MKQLNKVVALVLVLALVFAFTPTLDLAANGYELGSSKLGAGDLKIVSNKISRVYYNKIFAHIMLWDEEPPGNYEELVMEDPDYFRAGPYVVEYTVKLKNNWKEKKSVYLYSYDDSDYNEENGRRGGFDIYEIEPGQTVTLKVLSLAPDGKKLFGVKLSKKQLKATQSFKGYKVSSKTLKKWSKTKGFKSSYLGVFTISTEYGEDRFVVKNKTLTMQDE